MNRGASDAEDVGFPQVGESPADPGRVDLQACGVDANADHVEDLLDRHRVRELATPHRELRETAVT